VAEVEYESCADELRLCGGEPTLMRPSDILAFGIELPSPLPLSRLGVLDVGLPAVGLSGLRRAECRDLLARRLADSGTSGLPGRLWPPLSLLSFLGGCGKELMLMTLRRVRFDDRLALEGDLWAVIEADSRRLRVESWGRRLCALLGPASDDVDDVLAGLWRELVLVRAERFAGILGRGMVGGPPFDGLGTAAGRGMLAVMVS
jgi:hypothetical protein